MLMKHIFRKLNVFIAIFGFLFTIIYYIDFGDALSPILFTLLALTLSTTYSYKYRNVAKKVSKVLKSVPVSHDKANADICVDKIHQTIKSILAVSRDKKNLLLVTNFFKNIDEIEETVSKLHENYKKSKNFLDHNHNMVTERELEELQKKIDKVSDNKKRLYEKIYDNKKKIYDEIESIRGSLMENLLNLQYILSNLQQIQVTINSVNFSNDTDEKEMREAGNRLETFSEELKGSLNRMRI